MLRGWAVRGTLRGALRSAFAQPRSHWGRARSWDGARPWCDAVRLREAEWFAQHVGSRAAVGAV